MGWEHALLTMNCEVMTILMKHNSENAELSQDLFSTHPLCYVLCLKPHYLHMQEEASIPNRTVCHTVNKHCTLGCLVYLRNLFHLKLLKLLLESIVWAHEGAHSLDCGQAILPTVVGDRHQIGHDHGGTTGHPSKTGKGHLSDAVTKAIETASGHHLLITTKYYNI